MFSGKKPDCVKCGYVILLPENIDVMSLVDRYMNFFIDGNGGINTLGVDKVLEWEEIEDKIQYAYKIQYYLVSYMNKKHESIKSEVTHGQTSHQSSIRSGGQRQSPNKRRR